MNHAEFIIAQFLDTTRRYLQNLMPAQPALADALVRVPARRKGH